MVIEDDHELQQLMRDALTHGGFNVLLSDSATDAIGKLQRQKVQLVVLDLSLRQGSGEVFIEQIRNHNPGGNASTPILIASGTLDLPLLERTKTEIQGVLLKPYSIHDLVSRARSLLLTKAS
jgi:DNA-binding response OmpR family regulator